MVNRYFDRDTALQQIRSCGFACEAGPIEMNVAFSWLCDALARGPKFLPGQGVLAKVKASAAGLSLEQERHFYVVGVVMDSDTDRRFWKYSLSYDPPQPYHYGTTHLTNVREEDIRIPTLEELQAQAIEDEEAREDVITNAQFGVGA